MFGYFFIIVSLCVIGKAHALVCQTGYKYTSSDTTKNFLNETCQGNNSVCSASKGTGSIVLFGNIMNIEFELFSCQENATICSVQNCSGFLSRIESVVLESINVSTCNPTKCCNETICNGMDYDKIVAQSQTTDVTATNSSANETSSTLSSTISMTATTAISTTSSASSIGFNWLIIFTGLVVKIYAMQ